MLVSFRPLAINNFSLYQMSCFYTFFLSPNKIHTRAYVGMFGCASLLLMHCILQNSSKLETVKKEEYTQRPKKKLVMMTMTMTTKTFTLNAINLNGRHCLAFAQRPKIAQPRTFCIHFTIDCYRKLSIRWHVLLLCFFLLFLLSVEPTENDL